MSIKSAGGVFGRNPTFNDVTVEGDLSVAGTLSVNGNVLSGLDFEGAWDATSGAPSATPSTGQFWIVSVAGTTNLSGITNWGIGDWALYDGSAWQRIEGGADGNFNQLTSSSTTVLNGTTIPASKTLVVTTDIGSTIEAYDATILKSADIGSAVQGYDADTAKYDDTTANFTGTLQNGGSNVVVDTDIGSTVQAYDATILKSADIGSTVQAYDADTTKNDVSNTFTQDQIFNADVGIGVGSPSNILHIDSGSTPTTIQIDSNTEASIYLNDKGGSPKGYKIGTNISSNDGQLEFKDMTANAERMRITSSGDVTVSTGNLVIGTSGKGIDFSATAGTGTSELLDDYEEGTWTPVVTNGTSNATMNGTTYGLYTKIGRQVTVTAYVRTDSLAGLSTGNVRIAGLPFAAGSTNNAYHAAGSVAWAEGFNITAGTALTLQVQKSNTFIYMQHFDSSGGSTYLQFGEWANYSQAAISATYFTA
jgi:hypothetical protein